MSAQSFLSEFGAYLLGLNRSPRTISAYVNDCSQFHAFRRLEFHFETPENQIWITSTKKDIEEFRDLMLAQRRPKSVSRLLTSLRCLYEMLRKRRLIEVNPTRGVHFPERKSAPINIIKPQTLNQLVSGLDEERWQNARDRAVLLLMYCTGLLVSELVALNTDSIDASQEDSVLTVAGIAPRGRRLKMTADVVEAIRKYEQAIPPRLLSKQPATSRPLFLSKDGRRMKDRAISKILRMHKERAGINENLSPYSFRHAFAVNLACSTNDNHTFFAMLGRATGMDVEREAYRAMALTL